MNTNEIEQYINHLRVGNASPHTVEAYRRDLAAVFTALDILCPGIVLRAVTPTLLDEALQHDIVLVAKDGTPRSPSSIQRIKASTRSFFAWAEQVGLIDSHPARYLQCPKLAQRPPNHMTARETKTFLRVLRDANNVEARRDRAIFEVFLGTGIRLAELVALNLDNIDLESKHMRIVGKGGVPQVKFLKESVRIALRGYLAVRNRTISKLEDRKKIKPADYEALFLSNQGTRITPRQIHRRLAYWLRRAGIAKTLSPHSLRHTFATRLYEKSGDLLVVQRALGHKHLATTTIYTHLRDEQLQNAIEDL
ncbi:MAG TPA: tyrosine-type recombinase/integrase [Candidatus Hydrogenedentes bacterium]|nr:tyrosine-type recombinase/integrase [Candidatus Hydrogenedentota bacterium]HOV74823.1 tyrosine-type recombinase/integrase [Candidatus Hydrogenedentota bacterium]